MTLGCGGDDPERGRGFEGQTAGEARSGPWIGRRDSLFSEDVDGVQDWDAGGG